jgi:soluble lytic murein transglycosylase
MIPDAARRLSARLFLSLAMLGSSLVPGFCQAGGAFGMSAARLAELLAGGDVAPILAFGDRELGDTGTFGPSAYYFLARWIDTTQQQPAQAGPAAEARLLYRMAYARGSSLVRREAGLSLLDSLSVGGLWDELLAFSSEYAQGPGPEWKSERPRLEALDALGRGPEAAALAARLGSAYPNDAAKDAEALAYFAAAADLRSGGKAWPRAFRRLLLERQDSDWSTRAFALVRSEPRLRARFSEEELQALAMRDAIRRKDYGAAYRAAALAPDAVLSRSASQPMVADAGKAFLYSGMAKEGEARFEALEASASKRPAPTGASAGITWTALYYRARFARELGRWEEAARLFRRAASETAARADADSCLWYAADSAYQGALSAAAAIPTPLERSAAESAARAALLDALAAASASWRDPIVFSDLVDGLFRDALRARDWRLIESMGDRLAGRLGADCAARVAYTATRAFELGLDLPGLPSAGPGPETGQAQTGQNSARAAVRFAAIADDPSAPLYYRALAAWRAGIEPMFVPPDASDQGGSAAPGTPSAETPGEVEAFVGGMAAFGLGDLALSEARDRAPYLSDDALRRLAAGFIASGRPDCGIRLALDLASRPDYRASRADYELLYPRPYLDEIHALRLEERLPERLAYGLVRSESLFRADVVSRAGAVGLSQLMPATAAGQAKAIGLFGYDLKKPGDNLAIGLAHFAALLERAGKRPLRAMMAYNAGWGRLKTWVAESGDLPDDLLVEALGIDETRQYCRNILQATVMYGQLYYGRSGDETVSELVPGD